MKLYVTRDSVAASDDFDAPYVRNATVSDDADVSQIVAACLTASPLPTIAGGDAKWAISSGVPLALFAQQWGVSETDFGISAQSQTPRSI